MKDYFYSYKFFYIDTHGFFDDFKDKLELELYWDKNKNMFIDLSVNQFIKILESTPTDQKYNLKKTYNIEIMAYVIEFRNQDLKSGRCDPIDPFLLFKYYYVSNQLEKALNIKLINNSDPIDVHCMKAVKQDEEVNQTIDQQFERMNKLLIIELLRKKIIKSIIKFNYIDDLNLIYQFIKNIVASSPSSNDQYFTKPIFDINQSIIISLLNYNNLNASKFLYEIDKFDKILFNETTLKNSLHIISKYHNIRSIEVIDYLIIKKHDQFYWK